MSVAKNAAKDIKGEAKETAGKLAGKEGLQDQGHLEREEAIDQELDEEVQDGYDPDELEHEHISEAGLGSSDFGKDSTKPVEEVVAPDGHSR
ncbi:MAG TPA: hypothetical protein VGH99_16805 [Pseudonocardia sp.]|jgi:uncharacterized protein YjbJ (UPF0337 family)